MPLKITKILAILFVFGVGILVGHYFSPKQPRQAVNISQEQSKPAESCITSIAEKKKDSDSSSIKAIWKLELLKDYINLIESPKDKISDPDEYVRQMSKKVSAIDESGLTDKYSATGDAENKEQKIIDFFNFVIDDVENYIRQ